MNAIFAELSPPSELWLDYFLLTPNQLLYVL